MFGKKEAEKNKFERYHDPTGEFSNRSLKLGEWYLRHKILLQKIGMGILLAWCIVSMSIGIGYFGYYLILGYPHDNLMYARQTIEFENYSNLQALYKPQDLQIRNIKVFSSAPAKYDMAALVLNPNERWLAKVDFHYNYSDKQTDVRQITILPGETLPMIYFGLESNQNPGRVELILDKVDWQNIDRHALDDVSGFINNRRLFLFENFNFTKANRSSGITSSIIEFDITNAGAYGYWEPVFIVELLNGQTVGYLYVAESQFRVGETRHIEVHSLVDNLDVTEIKVSSLINVFDGREFIEPGE